jgi:hypothetical protein
VPDPGRDGGFGAVSSGNATVWSAVLITLACAFGWQARAEGAPSGNADGWGFVPSSTDDVTTMNPAPKDAYVMVPMHILAEVGETGPRALEPDVMWCRIVAKFATDRFLGSPTFDDCNDPAKRAIADLPTANRIAFRLFLTSSSEPEYKDLPRWMPSAWRPRGKLTWSDPGFLALHDRVLRNLGRMAVEHRGALLWIDIGTFGDHGEWHTDAGRLHDADEGTRINLIDDYLAAFPSAPVERNALPLSIAFDAIQPPDDGPDTNARVRAHLGEQRRIGIRFDCLGEASYTDPYTRSVKLLEDTQTLADFAGPWGGEYCHGNDAALATTGRRSDLTRDDQRKGARFLSPTAVRQTVDACHWSYIASAGSVLLQKPQNPHAYVPTVKSRVDALDALLRRSWATADRRKCAAVLAAGALR